MNKLLIGILFFTLKAMANGDTLALDQQELLKKHRVGPLKEQAYCYLKAGEISGHRENELQRIASVTKLFTTLLAAETLDLHQTYKTKIYIGKGQLHIEGGKDPFFEEEKLLLLLQELNRRGHSSFRRVTFDGNFLFTDARPGSHKNLTAFHTRARLAFYLNPKNKRSIKAMWLKTLKFASEEGVDLDERLPSVSAAKVLFSSVNPIKENTAVLVHESRPLHALLKSMNVLSKNIVAQNIFAEASKEKQLPALLEEKGILSSTYKIYNGSGLPIKTSKKRWDNLSTCATVIKVVSALDEGLRKHKLLLTDVVAVSGGQDLGTFRTRFGDYPETLEAIISKTGTVNFTSSLAGVLSLDEQVPFAVLNHTSNIEGARNFQDAFVARMFHHLGSPVPVPYAKIQIFPWDGSEFLREVN